MTERVIVTKRQFLILSFLEEKIEWTSTQLIGEAIGVSNKTIQNDIHSLQPLLPDGWKIEAAKGLGTRLVRPQEATVHATFTHEEQQLLHRAIHLLIDQSFNNLQLFSHALYASTSVASSILKEIDQKISRFQLTLQKSPYSITGDERNIRLLLVHLDPAAHAMISDQPLPCAVLSDTMRKKYGVLQAPVSAQRFCSYIEIMFLRIQKGYTCPPYPRSLVRIIERDPFYEIVSTAFQDLEALYAQSLSETERMMLFLLFLQTEFRLDPDMHPSLLEDALRVQQLDHSFNRFIRFLKDSFQFERVEPDVLESIQLIYYAAFWEAQDSNVPYGPLHTLTIASEHRQNLPTDHVQELCHLWESFFPLVFSQQSRDFLTLLLYDILSDNIQLRVLIVTQHSTPIGRFIQHALQRHVSGRVHFDMTISSCLNKELSELQTYDFLITDLPLPSHLKSMPHFFIHTIITKRELLFLQETIDECLEEKEKKLYERSFTLSSPFEQSTKKGTKER